MAQSRDGIIGAAFGRYVKTCHPNLDLWRTAIINGIPIRNGRSHHQSTKHPANLLKLRHYYSASTSLSS